jgi:integrase
VATSNGERRRLDGLFKRCGCKFTRWPSCPHPYYLRFKPKGGAQRRVPLGVSALGTAKARADEERTKMRSPTAAADPRLTIADACDRYGTWRAENGRSPEPYLGVLRRLMIPGPKAAAIELGSKPIADVTLDDVEAALRSYRAMVKKRQAGGAVGERKVKQAARQLFNWAVKNRLTTNRPLYEAGVPMVSIAASASRTRRLEPGEEQRLLDAAVELGDIFTHDRIVAILDTGMRGGELRLLQWRDVREHEIVVPIDKQKAGPRKKRPAPRVIPISPRLRKILDCRRKGPDGEALGVDALVFGTDTGEPVQRRHAHALWEKVREKAGILSTTEDRDRGLAFHDLRAEAGSELLEAGVDIKKVSEALGHTTITMTQDYMRGRVGSLREAFEQRDAARTARAAAKKRAQEKPGSKV